MDNDRVKDVLFDAMALPEGQRDAFIDESCDTETAARVRELLAAHEGAPHTIDSDDDTAASATVAAARHPDQIAGRRILSALGEGGYGLVFLAEESGPLARHVAVKVIRPGHGSRDIAARFEAERRVLALMSHPGIAQVYEAGSTDDGSPYVVMEYVDGPPITAYCKQDKPDLQQRVELIEQVCLAVHHAHQKGVIHRDIKPSNVLVSHTDAKPVPKVIDFGIAKAIEGPLSGAAPDVTGTRQIIGTPQYMPPEQATIGQNVVDTRTDVYALGVLLYECLVGVPPFPRDKFATASAAELERIIRDETPPKPSARASKLGDAPEHQRLSRRLKGELDWIVQRATEKDPARRYPSAAALAADLRRWLDGQAVDAGPPSGLYRARKAVARHRLEFGFAAVVLLLIVAGSITSLVYANGANRQRLEAEREAAKYETITDFTQAMLTGIDPATARGADTQLLEKILADARAALAENPPEDVEVQGTLAMIIAMAYRSIASYEDAVNLAATASESFEQSLGEEANLTLQAKSLLAVLYTQTGRYEDGLDAMRDIYKARDRLYGIKAESTQEALSNLGSILHRLGRYEEAAEAQQQVYDAVVAEHGPDHLDAVFVLNNLALAKAGMGQDEEAIPMLQEVLEVQTAELGPDSPRTLATQNNLASQYRELGRYDEALPIYEQVLDTKLRVLPESHPSLLATMGNLADLYAELDRSDEAESLFRNAHARAEKGLPPGHLHTAKIRLGLAPLLAERGENEEAIRLTQLAHQAFLASLGPDHPQTIIVAERLESLRAGEQPG